MSNNNMEIGRLKNDRKLNWGFSLEDDWSKCGFEKVPKILKIWFFIQKEISPEGVRIDSIKKYGFYKYWKIK